MHFFQKTLKKDLSAEGQWEFLNVWYIMIIVNDVLIILGSAIKEQIERQVSATFVCCMCKSGGDHGGTVVKVLRYKSEGRWFDSRWCHWNFSLT